MLVFEMPGGFHFTALPAFVWLIGVVAVWQRDKRVLFMMLLPGVIALTVSATGFYPFGGRLILFLTPCLFLFIGEGIAYLFRNLNSRAIAVAWLALFLLAAPVAGRALSPFSQPVSRNALDQAFSFADERWQEGDLMYLKYPDTVAYSFGKRRFDLPESSILVDTKETTDQFRTFLDHDLEYSDGKARVWFPMTFFDYREVHAFVARMNEQGTKVEELNVHGAVVFAYEFEEERGAEIGAP